jgi:hypothetical protein
MDLLGRVGAQRWEMGAARDYPFNQRNLSRSTFPPDKTIPMRKPYRSILPSRRAPTGTAAEGSMTIFILSQT